MDACIKPENWISNYYNYFLLYTRVRVADSYIVEEIVQETFLSGLKSMKNYKKQASERTWLTSILKNKIVDHYRKKNTAKGRIERYSISDEDYRELYNKELSEDYFFDSHHNSDQLSYDDLKAKILCSLEDIPKRQAQVFKMKVIDGYETETISEKLNISRDNVSVLMHRAKKNVSSKLKLVMY